MRNIRGLHKVRTYVRSAPGTYTWLAILFVTTVAMHHMSPEFEQDFLRQRSTNIHELSQHPLRVLVTSAMWIDGGHWLPYAVLYSLVHAQTERWLGTLRWLTVCAAAHVLATLISEGALWLAIRQGRAPDSMVHTLDYGVSYALAGAMAVLTYRITPPWRYAYLTTVLIAYAYPLALTPTFTDLGHFLSTLIGLGCRPLVTGMRKPRPAQAADLGV